MCIAMRGKTDDMPVSAPYSANVYSLLLHLDTLGTSLFCSYTAASSFQPITHQRPVEI